MADLSILQSREEVISSGSYPENRKFESYLCNQTLIRFNVFKNKVLIRRVDVNINVYSF